MWGLADFRFDDGIEAAEVYVAELGPEAEPVSLDAAIAFAHERGGNLVAWWPPSERGTATPSCIVRKVSLPLRWERAPVEDYPPPIDERLWFEAPCGRRDFIIGSGNTFVGRMGAWCPHDSVAYNVSLGEMGVMSDESRYFVAGFLFGNAPSYPVDADGETDEPDLAAWNAATTRFRRTGSWYGRWGTCRVCGCVLLPDTAADLCHEHSASGAG